MNYRHLKTWYEERWGRSNDPCLGVARDDISELFRFWHGKVGIGRPGRMSPHFRNHSIYSVFA